MGLSSGAGFPAFALRSMFVDPAATLGGLRERPQWLYPLLLAAAYSVAVNFYVVQRVGFVRLIDDVMRANYAIDPQAVLEGALAHKARIQFFQGLSTFAGVFLTAFVVAKVLWLMLELTGRDELFRRVLAVTAHVTMLTAIGRESMLAITVTVMRNPESLHLRNPLATNPAFFFPTASPAATRLLESLDLVTLANIFLLALGLSKVATRLSLRAACVLVVLPWAIYLAGSVWLSGRF